MANPPLADRVPCYRHANRLTGARCTRCGRPICPDCMISAPVGHQCPTCVKEGNRGVPQGRPANRPWFHSGRLTPMVTALIAINVVLFLVTSVPTLTVRNSIVINYAQIPTEVARGQTYRLLTAAFLHAGVLHIVLNMFALLVLGPPVEQAIGRVRFLAVYLLSALGGSVFSYLLAPIHQAGLGASGAIFGLFGAWFAIARARRADTGGIVVLIAINLAFSFYDRAIDWRAHVGGLIAGLIIGAMFTLMERRPPVERRVVEIAGCTAMVVLLVALVVFRTHQINALA
jgi:membrane associated rhomboid family serine protease